MVFPRNKKNTKKQKKPVSFSPKHLAISGIGIISKLKNVYSTTCTPSPKSRIKKASLWESMSSYNWFPALRRLINTVPEVLELLPPAASVTRAALTRRRILMSVYGILCARSLHGPFGFRHAMYTFRSAGVYKYLAAYLQIKPRHYNIKEAKTLARVDYSCSASQTPFQQTSLFLPNPWVSNGESKVQRQWQCSLRQG